MNDPLDMSVICTTSVTQNVEQHFREAVRSLPATPADYDGRRQRKEQSNAEL
jgi:hypothetical protein